ncbi:MAG: diiron oxygenase, partial [Actinomycetota bacterium]|nr:diiron oxygenase [Actinomycetota bacterium]
MNSPFDQWYDIAGVRSGIRRMFADETDAGKVFYPQRLVPYLAHELLADLPESQRRALTIRHLYQFLLSTTHLETRVVNVTAELIANNRAGLDLPNTVRLDAFKVYCDEGYHALYSLD